MPPYLATLICVFGIVGLFWLDRDRKVRTSIALWIPIIWIGLACSRAPGDWFDMEPAESVQQVAEGSPVDRLVYTILIVLGLAALFNRKGALQRILKANGPILIFLGYCLMSLCWSDFPDVAFKRWIKELGDLVMVLVILTEADPSVALKRTFSRLSFVLIPVSILLIKYYPEYGVGYSPWGGPAINGGVTHNKNTLGVTCLLFGLGALWRFLTVYKERKSAFRLRQLLAQGATLAMVLWLFWKADSMTSTSSFLMAGILLVASNLRSVIRRPAMIHMLIVAMLIVSVSIVFLGASPEVLKMMGRNPSLTDRTEVWGNLLSLVNNPLIGTGFDSFWIGPRLAKMWSIYWWHPNEAHDGYLETYLNLGWIGLGLLAAVLIGGYRRIVEGYRRNPAMGSLMLAYFLVGVVYNFTEAAFFKIIAPAWIFLLLAMVSGPVISQRKKRTAVPQPWEEAPIFPETRPVFRPELA